MAASRKPQSAQPAKRRFFNYPRRHITSFRRWLPSWRFLLGTFLSVVALGAGFLAAAFVTTDVPSKPLADTQAQTTHIYYSDGTTLMGTLSHQNRIDIDIDDLPDYVPQAVVASEDRTFYDNSGVDLKGQVRAFVNNISGKSRQGASTITEQYIERYYVGDTTTYMGKLEEAIRAVKIRQEQSPDQILQGYMNTIYFGRGAYGIQTAAQAYFGKDAKDLSVSEAALLAGVIPSPSNYDPAVNKDLAEKRWNHTLDGMEINGWLTSADRAKLTFPATIDYKQPETFAGTQGYLLRMVMDELTSGDNAPFTEDQLNTGGYNIVTTFDKADQDALVKSVNDESADASKPDDIKVASASIDTGTGAVRAVYGGPDYLHKQQQNAATQDIVQPGSTFKAFTLAAALEDGIPLEQTYSGKSPVQVEYDGTKWAPENEGNQSYGQINLLQATAYSVNTVFAQLNVQVTPAATADAAVRAGIPKDAVDLYPPKLSNTLGTASVHPIDMANAYATFANGGTYHPWYTVTSVTDRNGKVVYKGQKAGTKEFDTSVASNVSYALQQPVTMYNGTGYRAAGVGRPVAGKTGTTEDHQAIWFTGYTPQLATTVALYKVDENGNPQEMDSVGNRTAAGGDVPASIWTDYMKVATAKMPVKDFPPEDRTGFKQPTGAPQPTATTAPAPTQEAPKPTQQPTQAPEPTPTPTTEPTPTPTPTPNPTPDTGGGDDQNQNNRNPNSGGNSGG